MSHKIGAHVSISGGYENALNKIREIGGNCLQIFSSSPRNWGVAPVTAVQITNFKQKKSALGIDPIYFHASYLINLADTGRIGAVSKKTLIDELILAEKMGIKGTIVHLGSFKQAVEKDYKTLFENINDILAKTPPSTLFIVENAGNRKICCELSEMAYIINTLSNPRVKICLDTCHLYAGGYDLSTKQTFTRYFEDFDEQIGLKKLELLQINDSKDPLGSLRDRHENIGDGTIPLDEFRLLLSDPRTKDVPMILEVPGVDKKGPDRKSIITLRSLIA